MGKRGRQTALLALALALAAGGRAGAQTVGVVAGLSAAEVQVSPRVITLADPVRVSAALTWEGCPLVFQDPVQLGERIVIQADNPLPSLCQPAPRQTYRYTATLPPLPRGGHVVAVTLGGVDVAQAGFTVSSPQAELFLVDGGRFYGTLSFQQNGASRLANFVQLTGQSGYFWFFDSGNVEVTVKILDGRLVNGHYWVFVASMTDVPFALTLNDLASPGCPARNCTQKVYRSEAGKNTNFIDVTTF